MASRKRLTPLQEIEVWAWYLAKKQLGTYKTKARELGLYPSILSEFIIRKREKERLYIRKRERDARAKKFLEQLKECPF